MAHFFVFGAPRLQGYLLADVPYPLLTPSTASNENMIKEYGANNICLSRLLLDWLGGWFGRRVVSYPPDVRASWPTGCLVGGLAV